MLAIEEKNEKKEKNLELKKIETQNENEKGRMRREFRNLERTRKIGGEER